MMEVDGEKYIFKTANEAEVRIILDTLYAPLGWGYVLEDFLTILHHDPDAITIAVNENGEIIAAVTFLKINNTAAGFGSFCVKESYRGKGIGLHMHKLGLRRVCHLNVALTALESMFEKYKKNGFPVVSEVRGVRYSGKIDKSSIKTVSDLLVKDYTEDMFQKLIQYDKAVVSLERDNFMKVFLPLVKGSILVALKDSQIYGYAILRGDSHRLGPVYADDKDIAFTLISALLERSPPNIELIIDIPDCNTEMMDLVKQNNMKWKFNFPRMFSKDTIECDWKKVYAFHLTEVLYA